MSDDHLDDKFCTISPLHHQPYPPKVPPPHSNSMFAAAVGGGGGGCKSDSLCNCFFLLGKGEVGKYLESLRGHFFQDLLGNFLLIHIQNRFH